MLYSHPQLFVIGGPNGAGKSTISEGLLKPIKIKAFDWDMEFYAKWSGFGYDPLVEQGVREATNDLFSKKKAAALDELQPFAFETNFHQDAIFDIADEFKAKGFQLSLYFLLVADVDICKIRVDTRVAIDHGHPVDEQTIKDRFVQGLDNLNRSAGKFDKVFLYDASQEFDMQAVAVIEKGRLVKKVKDIPAELKEKLSLIAKIVG